ncbi:MAG: hypothetical protein LBP65_03240 [Puniceicoccales bacterium]|nr:hypothetical protein [Puniceicoccales bacterium]
METNEQQSTNKQTGSLLILDKNNSLSPLGTSSVTPNVQATTSTVAICSTSQRASICHGIFFFIFCTGCIIAFVASLLLTFHILSTAVSLVLLAISVATILGGAIGMLYAAYRKGSAEENVGPSVAPNSESDSSPTGDPELNTSTPPSTPQSDASADSSINPSDSSIISSEINENNITTSSTFSNTQPATNLTCSQPPDISSTNSEAAPASTITQSSPMEEVIPSSSLPTFVSTSGLSSNSAQSPFPELVIGKHENINSPSPQSPSTTINKEDIQNFIIEDNKNFSEEGVPSNQPTATPEGWLHWGSRMVVTPFRWMGSVLPWPISWRWRKPAPKQDTNALQGN